MNHCRAVSRDTPAARPASPIPSPARCPPKTPAAPAAAQAAHHSPQHSPSTRNVATTPLNPSSHPLKITVDGPAQGPQTTSENTSGAPDVAFSAAAAAGAAAADQKTRLPKTTTAAGLRDPFRVSPLLVVDNDPPRSGWADGTDG